MLVNDRPEDVLKRMTMRKILDDANRRIKSLTRHFDTAWSKTISKYEGDKDVVGLLKALEDSYTDLFDINASLATLEEMTRDEDILVNVGDKAKAISDANPFFISLLDRPFILLNVHWLAMSGHEISERFDNKIRELGMANAFLFGITDIAWHVKDEDRRLLTKGFRIPIEEIERTSYLITYRNMTLPNVKFIEEDYSKVGLEFLLEGYKGYEYHTDI